MSPESISILKFLCDLILDVKSLYKKIVKGDRFALSKGLTLIESTQKRHFADAQDLLSLCWSPKIESFRMGISGPPGVGKSTFIETLGMQAIDKGHKVAVLSIDPSSVYSKGSILGDKTRMEQLSNHDQAFIRPSANKGHLGGLERRTFESIILCEAAGFDFILIESVGVGQSEIEIRNVVDLLAILILPGSGDEIQGIKRGIIEVGDLIIVHKADGPRISLAKSAVQDFTNATHLYHKTEEHWQTKVMSCSSLNTQGFDLIWQSLDQFKTIMNGANLIQTKRLDQYKKLYRQYVTERIMDKITQDLDQNTAYKKIIEGIESGTSSPFAHAVEFVKKHYSN